MMFATKQNRYHIIDWTIVKDNKLIASKGSQKNGDNSNDLKFTISRRSWSRSNRENAISSILVLNINIKIKYKSQIKFSFIFFNCNMRSIFVYSSAFIYILQNDI